MYSVFLDLKSFENYFLFLECYFYVSINFLTDLKLFPLSVIHQVSSTLWYLLHLLLKWFTSTSNAISQVSSMCYVPAHQGDFAYSLAFFFANGPTFVSLKSNHTACVTYFRKTSWAPQTIILLLLLLIYFHKLCFIKS